MKEELCTQPVIFDSSQNRFRDLQGHHHGRDTGHEAGVKHAGTSPTADTTYPLPSSSKDGAMANYPNLAPGQKWSGTWGQVLTDVVAIEAEQDATGNKSSGLGF